jgi:hypothetical protein
LTLAIFTLAMYPSTPVQLLLGAAHLTLDPALHCLLPEPTQLLRQTPFGIIGLLQIPVSILHCSQQRAYALTNLQVRLQTLQNPFVADLVDFHGGSLFWR